MKGNIFTDVNMRKPRSNTFNLTHDKKLSFKMGQLVPICVMETVPGDHFEISCSQLLRFSPLIAPIMHQVNVYTHFFFVPNRLVWSNWEKFITGGLDGLDTTVPPTLDVNMSNLQIGTFGDYMGLPAGEGDTDTKVNAIPFAAYLKIYNEYYVDQNLDNYVDLTDLTDGDNTSASWTSVLNGDPAPRAWGHDLFTSALPFTQKGPEATIPLGTSADLDFNPVPTTSITNMTQTHGTTGANEALQFTSRVAPGGEMTNVADNKSFAVDVTDYTTVDLSNATAAGIIDLRNAFKLQEWLEKNARGGSRYTENILAHFGVKSSDARLQRPEFLGGSKTAVAISEVLQTSDAAAAQTPQGNMAGHGIALGASKYMSKFCEEHGYIIGIMSVLPKTSYFQGASRFFFKFDKFDYYWPSFAHIGEQPIYNKELYIDDSDVYNDGVFGYAPRYNEYKYIPSTVHGEFRTTHDFWHMARKFSTPPVLNEEFVRSDPDTRIFAVTEAEHMYSQVVNRVKATRRMPYFGNPKM